jgi:hypothetical protein
VVERGQVVHRPTLEESRARVVAALGELDPSAREIAAGPAAIIAELA